MNIPLATIILAAGQGKRMGSDLPKVLHKVGNKPMIKHVIDTAKSIGSDKIIVVLGYKANVIKNALKNEPINIAIQLKQMGTAHAVLQCFDDLKGFNGNVLILYGDVPLTKMTTLSHLINFHNKNRAHSSILTTELPNPYGYGRIVRDSSNSLIKIVEEKDATDKERKISEINSGIYLFDFNVLYRLLPLVNNNNKQKEYYLPDVLNLIIHEKGKVAIDKINNYIEIQGVNNIDQLTEVNNIYENY